MKGYKIYGKYQKKPYGKKWIISALPSFFGPKLVQVPTHHPREEVRNLARRIAKKLGKRTVVTEQEDTLTIWIKK